MSNKNLYLLGASGHAKVILEILEASGIKALGLFDDNPGIMKLLSYQVLGTMEESNNYVSDHFIISIGNNSIRCRLAKREGFTFQNAIHPSAILSASSTLGTGTVLMAGAIVNAGTIIGNHVIINTRASVDHDCVVEDFVHISPGATITGNVKLAEGAHIGAGAVLIPGIEIGKWAIIGAGAVIIKNVPDYAVVVGNPGRVIREGLIC